MYMCVCIMAALSCCSTGDKNRKRISLFRMFGILMWKNYLILTRKPIMLFCMTVVPGCWALLVLAARKNTTLYAITMPSVHGSYPIDVCDVKSGNHKICRKHKSYLYFNPDVSATRDIMAYSKTLLSK